MKSPDETSIEAEPAVNANTILIVDDEPDNCDLAARWLRSAGYRCEIALSGDEALQVVRTLKPNLLLLDVMMPGTDGYAVCQEVLSDPMLSDTPVIFVTAHNNPQERVRGLQLGAADYLSKPYDGDELVARVAAVLRAKGALDSLQERANRLQEQSLRDPLTGLYNRRMLSERLAEEVSRSERYGLVVSCLMLDIDYFKQVNDTFGHPAGDTLLRQVSETIIRCARNSDVIARYGGEEFVVVLPQTGPREAYEVAERIRRRISDISVGEATSRRAITVSIGVASYPGAKVHDMVTLLDRADQALLRAKVSGKNRSVLSDPGFRRTTTEPDTPQELARKILIVEDEPNNQVLLQKILSRMGYEWVCVSDGADAVSHVAIGAYSLVLMDLSLPGMDGWTAARAIREAGNAIPIVATTAHAMAADRQQATEAGCNDYITKPFNLSELRRVVELYAPLSGI